MKQFVGTKRIAAAGMSRGAYNELRGWELPNDEVAEDEGYLVEYSDGYISWSPKEQFEKAYRDITTIGLNFSQALTLVKEGVAMGMARKNWNGALMYVIYQPGYPDGIPANENMAKALHIDVSDTVRIRPHMQLKTADGSIAEWAPSGSDVIEEDWMLIYTEDQYNEVI